MPVIPQSEPRREIPVPRIESTFQNPDPYSQLAVKALDLHDRVSNAYDEMEAQRIAGEASANLSGTVKQANLQYGNPDEFANKAAEGAQAVYDKAVQSAGNERIRQKVISKLSDNYNAARNGIAFDAIRKKHDITLGDWENQKAEAAREFATLDDKGKETKLTEMKAKALELANMGILSHAQAAKDGQDFQSKAWREDAALFASKQPFAFQDEVDKGRYQGKLSGTDLQTALDIAERTVRAQDAHDARLTAKQAKIDEEDHYVAAKGGRLDEDKLRRDQRTYGWSEDKVNSILRVQLGLKTSNPYADQLISQAARLDDPIYPTPEMVHSAQRRLDRLIESGQVSKDSVEYQRVTRELRIIASNAARSNSPENQEKGRAKTFMRDLLNSAAPDMDAEEKRKILGDYFTEINKMQGVQGLDALKQKFEKQVTEKKKVIDPSKDAADRLRGLVK